MGKARERGVETIFTRLLGGDWCVENGGIYKNTETTLISGLHV